MLYILNFDARTAIHFKYERSAVLIDADIDSDITERNRLRGALGNIHDLSPFWDFEANQLSVRIRVDLDAFAFLRGMRNFSAVDIDRETR